MNAETLIREAQTEGVTITLFPEGKITLSGKQRDREKWVGILKPHREEVIRLLTAPTAVDVRSWRWRLHFADRDPMVVSFSPEVTHTEVLKLYPEAVAAEPVPDAPATESRLTPKQETAIRGWLTSIGETDPAIIEEVIGNCRRDANARDYYLGRANPEPFDSEAREEWAAISWAKDDRRCCIYCLNLLPNGVCKAAAPGELVHARRGYQPNQSWLQRCLGYRPCPDDPDRRPGRERWPGLSATVQRPQGGNS